MPVIKVSICEQWRDKLEQKAEAKHMTIPDLIRDLVRLELSGQSDEGPRTIFTPEEAVQRALEQYEPGECFVLSDLYGDEWTLTRKAGDNGELGAGPFGRKFFNYLEKHKDIPIEHVSGQKMRRQTLYRRVKKEET